MYIVDIIDDSKMFANGIANTIGIYNSSIKIGVVKYNAQDYLQYLQSHKQHQPHIAVIDYRMPGLLGWHLSYLLQQQRPEIQKIGMSNDIMPNWINSFIVTGCKTFISKEDNYDVLAKAVACVAQNQPFYSSYFTPKMQVPVCLPTDFPFGLNDKEFFYIHLCQTSFTNKAIAALLDIKFEEEHLLQKKLFKQFNVHTKTQLVQEAQYRKIIKYNMVVE